MVAVLVTGAETSLLYLLTAVLVRSPTQAPAPWMWLWAAGLVAYFLPRRVGGVGSPLNRGVIATAILLTTLFSVYRFCFPEQPLWSAGWIAGTARDLTGGESAAARSVPILVLALIGLWWRQLARLTPGSDTVEALFRSGSLPVAALAVAGAAQWRTNDAWMRLLTWQIVAFFGLSLLALAYTGYRSQPSEDAGRRTLFVRWVGASFTPVLLALLVASIVSAVLFDSATPVVQALVTGVFSILGVLVIVVGSLAGRVMTAVLSLVALILSALKLAERPSRLPPPVRPERKSGPPPAVVHRVHVDDLINWLLLAIAVLVVVYLFNRYRPRRESESLRDVGHESAWKRPDLKSGLSSLYGRVRGRLSHWGDDPLRAMLADPTWRYTAEIRRAYGHVQRLYTRAGHGRYQSQTAWEHAQTQTSEALLQLTAIYQEARYSTRPAPRALAARARDLEATIRAELRS